MSNFFNTRLESLRTVGSTQRAQLLGKELGLFTYGDLIQRYPFRYLDRTQVYNVADLHDDLPYVQEYVKEDMIQMLNTLKYK